MAKRVLIISTTFVLAATRKYLLMPLQTEQGHREMRLKLFPSEIRPSDFAEAVLPVRSWGAA